MAATSANHNPETSFASFAEARAACREAFLESGDVHALLKGLAECVDAYVRQLAEKAPIGEGVAVVAVGGYGRSELFPYSDVDILFLHAPEQEAAAASVAQTVLYPLWDAKLTIGQAVRTIDATLELARGDLTVRTHLLEARHVAGDAALTESLIERYLQEVVEGTEREFVQAKLDERDSRHQRFGQSRYLLEPNVKEGKGGLRDLHTLQWIVRYVYGSWDLTQLAGAEYLSEEEAAEFGRAEAFLKTVRAHLHYLSNRAEERLTFDAQTRLAPMLGFEGDAVEAVTGLMKRYFATCAKVGTLTRIVCALLEEASQRPLPVPLALLVHYPWRLTGFVLDHGRLMTADEEEFAYDPVRMLELFAVAQESDLEIHPKALQQVRRNLDRIDDEARADRRASRLFLSMLLSVKGPGAALSRMNEVGLLGAYIPEFGAIVGQTQFNMYHIYTVDEHTIVALTHLHALEYGQLSHDMPQLKRVLHSLSIAARRTVFLALLCHDAAKGKGTDHSAEGEMLARRVAKRLGLSDTEAENAGWLVKSHLLMSTMAFKRDVGELKAVEEFARAVQTVERLRQLYAMTVADILAVGPTIWNGWKGALLQELYRRSESVLTGHAKDLSAMTRTQLADALQVLKPHWPEPRVAAYVNALPAGLLALAEPETHARILSLWAQLQETPVTLGVKHDEERGITELIICAPDKRGLFSMLAGTLSLTGADIVAARIYTLADGSAVDLFWVQSAEGKAFDQQAALAKLHQRLKLAVEGKLDIEAELKKQKPRRLRASGGIPIDVGVFVDNEASAEHTLVELTAHDRPGLLHDATRALADCNLTITAAQVATYGQQAVDVFYVKDAYGMKLSHAESISAMEEKLRRAVGNQ